MEVSAVFFTDVIAVATEPCFDEFETEKRNQE